MAAEDTIQPATATPQGGVAPLMAEIAPTLYRANAFRVAGLPLEASAQDIRRRAEALRMSESLRSPAPPGFAPLPSLDVASPEEVRDAFQRLQDPEARVIEELFWFWPIEPGAGEVDPALEAMAAGDFATASDIWRNTASGGVGLHNLAVLTHAVALDHEEGVASQPLALDDDDRDYLARLWRQAYLDWAAVTGDERFWQRYADRLAELDDPRLTAAVAEAVRGELPRAVLSINARLLVLASERGRTADRTRHLSLVRDPSLGRGQGDEVLRVALLPVRQRIDALCKAARADSAANSATADTAATRLLDQAATLLAAVDALPQGHSTRDGARDAVADAALMCQIAHSNATSNWSVALPLLRRIYEIAAGESVRRKVKENIDIVEGNVAFDRETNRCWFCETGTPDVSAVVVVEMHGEVARSGGRVNWRQRKVNVPRCPSCRRKHGRGVGLGFLGFLVTSFLGVAYCSSGGGQGAALGVGWLMFAAAFVVFAAIDRVARRGIKNEQEAKQFPAAQRLVKEGWAFGAKPPGVAR